LAAPVAVAGAVLLESVVVAAGQVRVALRLARVAVDLRAAARPAVVVDLRVVVSAASAVAVALRLIRSY
jgi:hypothetical protein